MYIIILSATPGFADKIQATLSHATDSYVVASTWPDVTALVDRRPPDLIIAERTALARMELASLLKLTEASHWPPLLLVSTTAVGTNDGTATTRRLVGEVPPYHQIGDLRIDTRRKRAGLGDRWVALPPIQYRLLLTLAESPGQVIDCQELLRLVWGYEAGETEARELVKVHIRQIRRRLGMDPEKHHYIHSVRGFGYMLALPDEE